MAIEVVTGAPFSGKGQFVRDEIARREAEGELGLVNLDYTAIYAALVPGVESSLRDGPVSDTGAPRLVAFAYEVLLSAVGDRELSGYVTTNSPRKAVDVGDLLRVPVLNVEAKEVEIAERTFRHLQRIERAVARGAGGNMSRCQRAILGYLNEAPKLVGRAREVTRVNGAWTRGGVKPQFDRALWERGLTPQGRAVLDELVSEGLPEPSPTDVMRRLLKSRRSAK